LYIGGICSMAAAAWAGVTVAVTGACGGYGAFLTRNLAGAGAHVRALDLCPDHGRLGVPAGAAGSVEFVQIDLSAADTALLRKALRDVRVIFHTAVFFGNPPFTHSRFADPGSAEKMWAVNVQAVERLLDVAREQRVRAFVHTSSIAVVFPGNHEVRDVRETAPYPEDDSVFDMYAVTKAAGERLVLAANGEGGLRTASVRPNIIWGPTWQLPTTGGVVAMAPLGLYPAKLLDARLREPVADFTHVENLSRCQLLVAEQLLAGNPAVCGGVYHCNDGFAETYEHWVSQLCDRIGFRVAPIVPVPALLAYPVIYCVEGAFWALRRCSGIRSLTPPVTTVEYVHIAMTGYMNGEKARKDLGYVPLPREELMDGFAAYVRPYLEEVQLPAVPVAMQASMLGGMASILFLSFVSVQRFGGAPWSFMRTVLSRAIPALADMPLESLQRRVFKIGICLPMLGLHIGDALVAGVISRRRSHPLWINWTVRTSLFGFGQLRHLLPDSAVGPYALLTASAFALSAHLARTVE